MSLSAAAKCSVHISTTTVYPGDPVEGYVVVEAIKPFPVRNIHIKVVGRERVNTMVDHVSQSKTKDVQFGITTQDYVYYREVTTLVGDLLSAKRPGSRKPSREPSPTAAADRTRQDHDEEEPNENNSFMLESPAMTETSTATENADAAVNRSFAITGASMLAAQEGTYVTLSQGTYTFPFRYLLPSDLPPSYDTGVQVRDRQYSSSIARLRYYLKLYILSDRKLLATSSAFFTVQPMQPLMSDHTFLGCRGRHLPPDATVIEARFAVNTGVCCFGSGSDHDPLVVKMMLEKTAYEIDKDVVKVVCVVLKNNTGKAIQGVRLSLIQRLTFNTAKAQVPMSSTVLSRDTATKIDVNEVKKCVTATLPTIPAKESIMPTMCTTGLAVSYNIRVDVLASTRVVTDPFYIFEGVVLAARMDSTTEDATNPPSSEMKFTALPRGRLTRREAYYAVPVNPVREPHLPVVHPSSTRPTPLPSRRTSLLTRHE